VPMCVECHSAVHGKKMGGNALTRLGLIKADAAILARIFYLITVERLSYKQIQDDMKQNGRTLTIQSIKNKVKRMQKVDIEDLLSVFKEILQYEGCIVFNKQFYLDEWNYHLSNNFNTTSK
jgi:hypothetical protein